MSRKSQFSAIQQIRQWNLDSVKEALIQNDLEECCAAFTRHEIDGDDLLSLTEGKLALWKRDLTLSSIRKVSKFVADLKASPEKYLLRENSHQVIPAKPSFRPSVASKKPEINPKFHQPNPSFGSPQTGQRFRQETQSPVSESGSWDTDFEDEHDEPDAPVRGPIALPLKPVPSLLFGMSPAEPDRPALPRPAIPNRPGFLATKPAVKGSNSYAMPPTARPPGIGNLLQPSKSQLADLISKINLPESFLESDYNELEQEDEYSFIEEDFTPGFRPILPSREPYQMQPPSNIPTQPPNIPLKALNKSPTPQIPPLPFREPYVAKVPLEIPAEPPQLPPRDHVFLSNLAKLTKQSIPNSRTPNSIPSSLSDFQNSDSQNGNGYISDEYECIENPEAKPNTNVDMQEDYMPPVRVAHVRPMPALPIATIEIEMVHPYSRPPSPRSQTLQRKISDASSTSSSGGSSVKLSEKLRTAMANWPPSPVPSPSPSEQREKTPTPELQSKPSSFVQKPPAFQTNQRPLPPTPDPTRPGAGKALPPPPRQMKLTQMPWYHDVDRKRGEEMLKNGQEGYFMMRPSARTDNPMTLTLWYNKRLYNIGLRHRPDQRYALGSEKANEQSFISVEELVLYYQKEPLVLYSNGEPTGKSVLTSSPPRLNH